MNIGDIYEFRKEKENFKVVPKANQISKKMKQDFKRFWG